MTCIPGTEMRSMDCWEFRLIFDAGCRTVIRIMEERPEAPNDSGEDRVHEAARDITRRTFAA